MSLERQQAMRLAERRFVAGTRGGVDCAVSTLTRAALVAQLIAADGGMGLMDPALPLAIQQPELQPA
jgi:hypothetical protein